MKEFMHTAAAVTFVASLCLGSMPAPAQPLETAVDTLQATSNDTRESQSRIDELDSETQQLLNDYRANLNQLEQLQRYNESQRRQIEAQEREMESLRADIDNIFSLQRSVQPLMEDMIDGLGEFVGADLPFLPNERADRIGRLRGVMDDPSQSAAQRYRLLLEAYQIENEYGRTIEAYRGDVSTGDGNGHDDYENVEFLRIGRLALIFKTDDDAVLKIFDADARQWVDLDRSYLSGVKTALRIAREQIPPDLMVVPVRAPDQANRQ